MVGIAFECPDEARLPPSNQTTACLGTNGPSVPETTPSTTTGGGGGMGGGGRLSLLGGSALGGAGNGGGGRVAGTSIDATSSFAGAIRSAPVLSSSGITGLGWRAARLAGASLGLCRVEPSFKPCRGSTRRGSG